MIGWSFPSPPCQTPRPQCNAVDQRWQRNETVRLALPCAGSHSVPCTHKTLFRRVKMSSNSDNMQKGCRLVSSFYKTHGCQGEQRGGGVVGLVSCARSVSFQSLHSLGPPYQGRWVVTAGRPGADQSPSHWGLSESYHMCKVRCLHPYTISTRHFLNALHHCSAPAVSPPAPC